MPTLLARERGGFGAVTHRGLGGWHGSRAVSSKDVMGKPGDRGWDAGKQPGNALSLSIPVAKGEVLFLIGILGF